MTSKRKKSDTANHVDKRLRYCQSSEGLPDSSVVNGQREPEVGVIESVTMKNFMCHSRLEFTFSPNINFIIGKNGSGKSATLTAIIVALGGKALATGRGHAIKDFVLNGKRSAEVVVKLCNRGQDAYEHDVYGDSIIIERNLNVSGASSYKLKSENGGLISDKREDLIHILDQFNIQVDNPVSILNQEVSRHFLNSSSPHDKYKFFLKATQLEQIEREYCDADEQRAIAKNKLERKHEVLADLEKEVQKWKKRYRMLQSLNEMRQKIETLKNESAWAQVIEKEQALLRVEGELNNEQERHTLYEKKVEEHKFQHDEATQNVASLKDKLRIVSLALESLNPQCQDSKLKLEEEKKKCQMSVMEHRKVLTTLHPLVKDRDSLLAKIEELQLSSQSQDFNSEMKQRQEEMKMKNEMKTELEAQLRTTATHVDKLNASIYGFDDQIQKLSFEEKEYCQQADHKRQELHDMEASRNNRLRRFGQWVPELLAKIDDAYARKRFHQKPKGPIGACVKLRDPKWALAVECCMRGQMTTFCCHDYNDEKVLEELMASMRIQNRPTIVVSKFSNQVYNVQKHAVRLEKHWSVLDALIFDDPVVANFCIDQRGIESVLLFESNEEARNVMSRSPPENCHEAFTLMGDQIYPSPNFRYYSCTSNRAQWLQADLEGSIQILKEEQRGLEQRAFAIRDQIEQIVAKKNNNFKSLRECKSRHEKLNREVSQVHREILELRSADETESIDVSVLEAEVKELNQQIESLESKKLITKEEMTASKELVKKMEKELEEVHKKILSIISKKLDPLKDNLTEAEQDVNSTLQKLKHYEAQRNEHGNKLHDLETSLQRVTHIVEDKQQMAERICPRVTTKRTPAQLDKEIEQYMQQLHHQEQNHGSKEEVTRKYHEAKTKYDASCQDISSLNLFLKNLDKMMEVRKVTCHKFRREMGTRIRHMFMLFLAGRNFKGKIEFDHEREMLNINVQPLKEVKENVRDLKSLSGGERSYSTVCLILALWEATDSPFRILDEFDVFMDMVTRRFCMELMLNTAQDKFNKQFLFLTPQDMSALCQMPDPSRLKVYRMPDPVRKRNSEAEASQGSA